MYIKNILKSILPEHVKTTVKRINNNFKSNNSINDTFTTIYKSHYWDSAESVSGAGSELVHTRNLVNELDKLLSQLKIKSMLDIPCGDFNWMKTVNLNGINYLGADIVEDLIAENKQAYETENIKFNVIDLTIDTIPKVDLIFCRDCLVHLSNKNIYKALKNIKRSKSKYLLTTSFVNHKKNKNIITGAWRKINLENSPFNFKPPILSINENYTKKGNADIDKSMCLWEINTLKIPFILKIYGLITK